MRSVKKLISILLVLSMLVTVLPVNVNAREMTETDEMEILTDDSMAVAETTEELLEEEGESTDVLEDKGDVTTNSDLNEGDVIQNDETGIPDEIFYQAILKELGKMENQKFTSEEAKEVIRLDLSGSGVKDFTGIGNLPNLKYLDASDNELTELKGFTSLWNLETLILNNNKLTTLGNSDYIYMGGIRRLEVAENNFTGMPEWGRMYSLEILNISNNRISSIDAIYSYNLAEVSASYNEITTLEDFYFSDNLVKMDMSHNKISILPYWKYRNNFTPVFENGKPLIDISYNKLTKVEMIMNLPEILYTDEDWLIYNLQGQDATGQTIIRNDETGIPDPALYSAILEEGDIDQNGVLTEDEAEYMTYLYVGWSEVIQEYYTVEDLTGIGYLKNLGSLTITNLVSGDLDPLLELENLYLLSVRGKGVKDLDVIKQLEIRSLTIDTYNSPELSLAGLEEMTSLTSLNATIRPEDMEYVGLAPNLLSLDLNFINDTGQADVIPLELLTQTNSLMDLYIYGNTYYDGQYDEEGGYSESQNNNKIDSLECLKDFKKLESIYIHDVIINDDSSLAALNELNRLEFLALTYCRVEEISALKNAITIFD